MRVTYTIIFVRDMTRSVAFYRDVLGLPLKFESPQWSEFATQGATVALHQSEQPHAEDDKAQPESAGRCRPGFQVPNLAAFHQRMLEQNVRCLEAPTEVFGARLAQYVDPDGLVFSVGEAPREG